MIEQLLFLSFGLTVMFAVVVAQLIQLSRLLKSSAWYLLASGVAVIGLLRLWSLLKLPSAMLRAQAQGVMPEHLTLDNWISIGGGFLATALLIAGFDTLRRHLRRIGV